jgi:hypothetical protein
VQGADLKEIVVLWISLTRLGTSPASFLGTFSFRKERDWERFSLAPLFFPKERGWGRGRKGEVQEKFGDALFI